MIPWDRRPNVGPSSPTTPAGRSSQRVTNPCGILSRSVVQSFQ
jgi:hypothetical protein